MDIRKRTDYKTQIRVWLLTITLSIAVLAFISPAGPSSFQPQRTKTEVSWQVSARHLRTVIVYLDKTCSAVPAQNGSAIFPSERNILCTSNELVKIKFQRQRKLYASLKTAFQLSSIGFNPNNSEQEPLLG